MEEKSCHVPIEEVLQHPKSLQHSMEEILSYKSQTRKSCHSLREILSHDSNSITTSREANSIHESQSTKTSMTLKMEEKLHYVQIKEVPQQSKSLENSMGGSLRYESQNLSHDSDLIKMEENPVYKSHKIAYNSVEENKVSQSTQMKNILPNRICSKERMIIAMISIMFIIIVVCICVLLNSILMKSPSNNSSLQNQTNTKHNDDYFLIQAIKQSRKDENGPCTFIISPEIVKKYNISSWVLNGDNNPDPKGLFPFSPNHPESYVQSGPECHQYNLNFGHSALHHQYIYVDNNRCGSICDETNFTLNNTIHLKVKYDKFHERSISFPISCKYQSAKTLDDPSWSEYWWWNSDYI